MTQQSNTPQQSIQNFVESACEIAKDWYFAGQLPEAIEFLKTLTQTAPVQAASEITQAQLWATLGKLQGHLGFMSNVGFDDALETLEQAKLFAEQSDSPQWLAQALHYRGYVLYSKTFHQSVGQYEDARPDLECALKLREDLQDTAGIGESLIFVGIIHERLGETDQAKACYERCLALTTEHNLPLEKSFALRHLAFLRQNDDDLDGALDYFKQSLELREQIGMRINLPLSLMSVGHVCIELKRFEASLDYLNQGLALADELESHRVSTLCLYLLGEAHAAMGNVDEAIGFLEKSKTLSDSIGYQIGVDRAQSRLTALIEESS